MVRILPEAILKSIRVKFGLLILLLLFLVFAISSSVLIYRSINTQRENLITQSRAFAELSVKPIGSTYSIYYDSGFLKFIELMTDTISLNPDIKKVQIVSVTGDILFDSDDLQSEKPTNKTVIKDSDLLEKIKSNSGGEIPSRTQTSVPEEIIEPYFEDFGAHPFSVRYFVSYDSISQNLLDTIVATLFISLVFFVGAIVLIILVINRTILNPIEIVIQGAKKISMGDLSHTIKVETKDQVADLASAVNHMAQTLRKNIEDLKELDKLKDEFIFLASHNLRTPLTVIKGYVSTLKEEKSLSENVREGLENMEESTARLQEITENLLSLASLEKGKEVLSKKPVDMVKLLEDIADKFSDAAAKKGVNFIFEIQSKSLPKVSIEEQRMTQALTGLVDNAVKFNKKKGKVIIGLEKNGGMLVISIKDEGIGISQAQADKVFKKFHRGTDVLTYNYEGIGLGLYLTKLIIEAHQGKIWFDTKASEGSTFFVSLPINS